MSKSPTTKYLLSLINLLLAFLLSILGNKVADAFHLSTPWLLILLLTTIFLCGLGLVEYQHYLETGNIGESLVARSSKWFLQAANNRLSSRSSRQLEVCSIFCLSLSFLVILSLISYDARDPLGIFTSNHVNNWVGRVGASVSSFLFLRLGWLAYAVPVALAALSWLLFRAANKLRHPPRAAFRNDKRA